jgi:uncharacterized membrane protein YfcA
VALLGTALVVALAAAAQATTGFGFALVAAPLLAALLGGADAVVVVALVALPLTLGMAVRHRRHVDRATLATVALAGALGAPLGLLVLERTGERALQATIGVVVLVLATALALGLRVRRGGRAVDAASGFVAGVLSTSTGTNGPPLVLGFQARRMAPEALRATLAAVFAISGLVGLALFALAGRVSGELVAVAAAGWPGMLAGWWAGERLAARIRRRTLDRLVTGLLYLSALVALAAAASP